MKYIITTDNGDSWGDFNLIKAVYAWIILTVSTPFKWKIKKVKEHDEELI